MTFRISALPLEPFLPLFGLDEAALHAAGARRVVADAKPGYPCRVSLADAEIGDTLILVHHEHQPAATPFRASHAVYVRMDARCADLGVDEVPDLLRSRSLSLRGFDGTGMMTTADLCEGHDIEGAIALMLADDRVDYVHLHYAKPGCYAARIDRA